MTIEDAIEIIKSRNFYCIECIDRNEECCKALDMAIKALEQEPCNDLISRQDVNKLRKYNLVGGVHTVSLDDINKLPSARGYGDLISRTDLLNAIWQKEYGKDYDGVNLLNIKHIDIIEQLPSAEKTANKININEYVKVKLTDYGKEIFYHQYDNLNKTYGKEIIKPSYPTVDSDGYTSFQLWYFMNLYGRHIDMGVQNVIEPLEIVFESAEKTAEWISVRKQKPEDYEEVIATVRYDYKNKQEYEVVTGVRYSKEDGWEWAYEAGSDYWESIDGVVAWQPLPKPYEVRR